MALSVSGFWGVDQEWRYADTLGAKFSTFMQTLYSLFGVLAIVPVWRQRPWARPLLYLWAATLIFTGATAPIIWGGTGWGTGAFAAALMVLVSGAVIVLAPLPPSADRSKRWRWIAGGVFALAVAGIISVTLQYAPTVLQGRAMEKFCSGLQGGITESELQALAVREGYDTKQGRDEQGTYLQMDEDSSGRLYRCRARFKPDGTIASINFTANASL